MLEAMLIGIVLKAMLIGIVLEAMLIGIWRDVESTTSCRLHQF